MLGEDLCGSHAVREHGHYRRDRETQPPDAGLATQDSGVRGDAFVGHKLMLAAAVRLGTRRLRVVGVLRRRSEGSIAITDAGHLATVL